MIHRWLSHWSGPVAPLLLCLIICAPSALAASMSSDKLVQAGHVLNRIAYGPSLADLAYAREVGLETYIAEQLDPDGIDESDNAALGEKEEALFEWQIPSRKTTLIATGALWHYRKGADEPDVA